MKNNRQWLLVSILLLGAFYLILSSCNGSRAQINTNAFTYATVQINLEAGDNLQKSTFVSNRGHG
ncbi:MAG: hypothetical protein IPJ31_02695 [Bacteroidetes bacterium]|nr:hypothetical protein [Bacteroidota bacterium]